MATPAAATAIAFTDFRVEDGEVRCQFAATDLGSGEIWFALTPAIRPSNDLIALAVATLAGDKYERVQIDLGVSPSIAAKVAAFAKSEVVTLPLSEAPWIRPQKERLVLSFSGGFDSLAALCLMPDDTRLVSIDFGGRFARERVFFGNYDTCIVTTNLVETPLRANSWSFMGIALILFSDYLGTNYYTFGSILEAAAANFADEPVAARNQSFPLFTAAGMRVAPYVLGLTEVGTLRVMSHFRPDLVKDSLNSLATPGEEKRFRKQVLAEIEARLTGKDFGLTKVPPPPRPHFRYGQNFAVDFLAIWEVKHVGYETASHTCTEIPAAAVEAAGDLSLDFYWKYHPMFVEHFPATLKSGLLARLAEAGVEMYSAKDWEEFRQVRQLLSEHHLVGPSRPRS